MKNILKIAVITLSLGAGFTACSDDGRTELLADIQKTSTDVLASDSSLTAIQNYLIKQKDSLEQISLNDPKRKTEIDSVLAAKQKDFAEIDSVTNAKKGLLVQLDSLNTRITGNQLKTVEGRAILEKLQAENAQTKEYISKAAIFLAIESMEKPDALDKTK